MKRRLTGLVALAAIAGALVAGPATARAETGLSKYIANGKAVALDISIAGQELTLATADSAASLVNSKVTAKAEGAGALLALASKATLQRSGGTNASASPAPVQACSPLTLPADVPLLDLATGCGTAAVNLTNGLPDSRALGEVAGVGLGVVDLPLPLQDVLGPVQEALDQLLGALSPVTDLVGIDLSSTIDELLNAITQGGNALSVQVGPSSTHTFADGNKLVSEAKAAASYINILNRDLLNLAPVLRLEILPATARVVRDADTGKVLERAATPAVLTIRVAPDIALLTGLPQVIEVGTSEQMAALTQSGLFDANGCLNPGAALPAPLDRLVCVKIASIETYEDAATDTVGIAATALELRLLDSVLEALGQPSGVDLRFAHADANVSTVLGVEVPREVPRPPTETERSLPRTGGEIPVAAALGLAAAALVGMRLVRRSQAIGH